MIRVGIIGATGYAGGELVRILLNHKDAKIVWFGSRSYIDKKYYQVYQNMFQLVEDVCRDDNLEALADQVDVILVDVCLLLILHIPILLQPMTLRCARIGKQCLVFTTTKRIQMCNGGLVRDLVILNSTIVISE